MKMMWIVLIITILPMVLLATQSDREHLAKYMRVRGDASGEDVVYYWSGSVYSYIPQQRRQELFKFVGFNTAKTIVTESGFDMLTREAAFFLHPQSGQILETWRNPFTEETVPVVHIWNDPVNFSFSFDDEQIAYITRILPMEDLGHQVAFHSDIFPYYESPLSMREYPDFAQSDTYQAAEFFSFFVDKADLDNAELSTVPVSINWTRISPWMPFMKMGDRVGNLVFACRGYKLGSYEELPEYVKQYVAEHNPDYSKPPTEVSGPNATSWSYFLKLLESGEYPPKD